MAAISERISLASVVRDIKAYAQDVMKPEDLTESGKAEAKKIKEIGERALHHLNKIGNDLVNDRWGYERPQIPTPLSGSEVVEELFDTITTLISRGVDDLALFRSIQFGSVLEVFHQFLSPKAIPKAHVLIHDIAIYRAFLKQREIAAIHDRKIIANTAEEPFLKLFREAMPAPLRRLTCSYLPEYTKEDAIKISIANIYQLIQNNPPEGLRRLIEFANAYKVPFKWIYEGVGDYVQETTDIERELTVVDLRGFESLLPSVNVIMHLTTFLKRCTKAQEIFIFPFHTTKIQFMAFSGPNLCRLKALPVPIQDALIKSLDACLSTTQIFAYLKEQDSAYAKQAKEKWDNYRRSL